MSDLPAVIEARELAQSGRALRLREAAGLSRREVALAIGVSSPCIGRWERGERRPHGKQAVAYAMALREIAASLTEPAGVR